MGAEENKATVMRITEEIYNRGNLDIVEEVIAPNFVYHHQMGDITGRDGFRQMITMTRTGLPDLHVTIQDIVAEGEMVAIRAPYTGTHLGVFGGIPPTEKSVKMDLCLFIRFENGMQVEEWPYVDLLSLFQQLGVSPPS